MLYRGAGLIALLLCLVVTPLFVLPAHAQAQVTFLEEHVDFKFGEQITFWARLQAPAPIQQVEVLYRPQGASLTQNGEMTINEDEVTYNLDLELNPQFIPVYSMVEYRYRVTLQDGQVSYSGNYTFQYLDNRFNWQSLDEKPFHVYWVEGDLTFGQSIVDAARNGLKKANEMIGLPQMDKIDIFVYSNNADLQSALQLGGFDLAAGHASPELGVMTVSLPAGAAQLQEIQRQIPHELVHLLLYEEMGERYKHVPVWLNEGLASLNEPSPNPDYYVLLQEAVKNDTVLPMESLCSSFRLEASLFYLSYAQAESFTRYLYDNYGSSRLKELLNWYADGVECKRAPELAYGISFERLENRWLKGLQGGTIKSDWIGPLLPWLVMLAAALLVPIILAFRPVRPVQQPSSQKRASRGS